MNLVQITYDWRFWHSFGILGPEDRYGTSYMDKRSVKTFFKRRNAGIVDDLFRFNFVGNVALRLSSTIIQVD